MKILLCGADGFIGGALAGALARAGHTVCRAVRTPRLPGDIAVDFRRDFDPALWRERLRGCDAAINAVGILRDSAAGDFERIHHLAPVALFAACAEAGVARAIQISALGADTGHTAYLASKAAADRALLQSPVGGVVLRPALVFGVDGASSRLFLALASLPLIGLPGGGTQRLRPIHVDDLCALVCALLEAAAPPRVIDAVGGEELTYAQLLACHRHALGYPPALGVALPAWLMDATAKLAARLPGSLLTPDTWQMLRAGNTADVADTARLLGRMPRAPDRFLSCDEAERLRSRRQARWKYDVMRAALAAVWIGSGAVSLALPQTGLDLLGAFGLSGGAAALVLVGAAALDLALGAATLIRPGRRLWIAQMAVIALYSLLIAWRIPAFLVHPFAPVLKNVPLLAMLALLWAQARRA
jgi:uncharacterized protein YbjT (DUF2867 family)